MADIRNFRNYIEELSGNNFLRKKVNTLEKKNQKLERQIKELKNEIKAVKKNMAKPLPKPKGRKPRPMIKIIEDEMSKQRGKKMKVTDIVKMLKRKKVKSKTKNMYSSVAASLANSDKFEKVERGVYKLAGEKKAATKKKVPKKKKTAKK